MRVWLALFAAPSLVLACQATLYALVTPSCAMQTRAVLHAVAAGSLAVTLVFTLLALREWRLRAAGTGKVLDSDGADTATSRRFLAIVATSVGLLSCLAIAAMWITIWVLSPCWN
ncbi:MAG: hypothetical protein JWO05_1691 [Gemmatimonadetes bacterium]|nr:hypothetical protein [Gemmatimonadota bacterium]